MSDTLDMFKLSGLLKNYKWFFIVSFFGPAIVALIVSLFIPKSYTAHIRVLTPEVSSGGLLSAGPLAAISGLKLRTSTVSYQSVIAILKSYRIVSDVVKKYNIKRLYRFKDNDQAADYVRKKMVSISLNEDEGVIEIDVISRFPKLSRDIAAFYIEDLEKINQEIHITSVKPLVRILDYPAIPKKKSSPKTKFNMAIAGLLGLFFGFVYVYIKEKSKNVKK